jgi:GntR family transcriptional regulator
LPFEIEIRPESGVPIYLQIVERIKHLVAIGALRPDEQLPTIRRLAVELRVDPNTVARAYQILDREGVISTQQGRGTFIAHRPDDSILTRMRLEKLQAILDHALLEALSLGYELMEIEAVFDERVQAWRHERLSTDTESEA